MSQNRPSLSVAAGLVAISLAASTLLSGCGLGNAGNLSTSATTSSASSTGTGTPAFSGVVHGGQNPIVGATVALWAAGTTGTGASRYGAGATQIATTVSDANGNFTFDNAVTGASPCTTGQYNYITASGGNPGSGTNNYEALVAAIPTPCSPAATGALTVVVNEVTTVATVTALQQFMSINTSAAVPYSGTGTPPWTIGAPSTNVPGLANAFLQVGNLVSIATGTSATFTATSTLTNYGINSATVPNQTYSMSIIVPSTKIYTLADILSYCVNSTGSVCPALFSDTTPTGLNTPLDTIQSVYYIATNPGGLTMPTGGQASSPYHLCTTYVASIGAPFVAGTCSNYNDWALFVQWQSTANAATSQLASLAFDASGNLWSAQTSSSNANTTNPLEEFSQSGHLLIFPPSTGPIVGGVGYATYGSGHTFTMGDLHENAGTAEIAIDAYGNAWYTSWLIANNNGPTRGGPPLTVGSNLEGVLVEVTPGTAATNAASTAGIANGYLTQYNLTDVAIDPFGNIFTGGAENANLYTAEYTPSYTSGTPTALTLVGSEYTIAGVGTAGTPNFGGNTVVSEIVASNPNALANYAWTPGMACSNTIYGALTTPPASGTMATNGAAWDPGATASSAVTIALPTTPTNQCIAYITADSYGNLWGATGATSASPNGVNPGYIEYIDINPNHGGSLAAPVVTKFLGADSTGTPANTAGIGGISDPLNLAVDGAGHLWVANACNGLNDNSSAGGLSELAPSLNTTTGVMTLTALSPATNPVAGVITCGFGTNPGNGNFFESKGVFIDSSGNAWSSNGDGSYVDYFVGIAVPVVTPVVTAVTNQAIGVKP